MYTPLSEQRENIDCFSTLYSFEGPIEILHADIADIRFMKKLAVDPKYYLLFVSLFNLKICTYTIKNRSLLSEKIALFYKEIDEKRETGKKMRMQAKSEFEQSGIKRNKKTE